MGDGHLFFVVAAVSLVGGLGIGTGCERMRRPPTYSEQWKSVYSECARDEGRDSTRRADCIAAADRVMKCATEVKP